MMMILLRLLALAAVLCAPAFAAPPCLPGGPCLPGYSIVPNSQHYEEVNESAWKSRHGYWRVEDGAGKRTWHMLSCSEGNDCFTVKWAVYQISMYLAPEADKRRIQEAAYLEQVTYTCDAEAFKRTDWIGRVCREQNNILAANWTAWMAQQPAQALWTVKQLAGGTRPVQKISATNGLTSTAERIAVGAPCYPAVRLFQSSAANTYVAIDPARPDRVAVCAKAG